MKQDRSLFKRISALALLLSACSSAPKYERMRTLEDAVQNEDDIKPGMVITKKGSVLDISVEEIQEQKRKLIAKNAEQEQALKNLREDTEELRTKYKTLRIYVGLPPDEPKTQGQCCTSDGKLVPGTYKAAPTLSQELGSLKRREPTGKPPISDSEQTDTETEVEQ